MRRSAMIRTFVIYAALVLRDHLQPPAALLDLYPGHAL